MRQLSYLFCVLVTMCSLYYILFICNLIKMDSNIVHKNYFSNCTNTVSSFSNNSQLLFTKTIHQGVHYYIMQNNVFINSLEFLSLPGFCTESINYVA